jgi:hypothetical protein
MVVARRTGVRRLSAARRVVLPEGGANNCRALGGLREWLLPLPASPSPCADECLLGGDEAMELLMVDDEELVAVRCREVDELGLLCGLLRLLIVDDVSVASLSLSSES